MEEKSEKKKLGQKLKKLVKVAAAQMKEVCGRFGRGRGGGEGSVSDSYGRVFTAILI